MRRRSYRPTVSIGTSIWSWKNWARAWRETDEADTDRETVLRDIIAGQHLYPLRIVAFNPKGWSRDATADLVDEIAKRVTSAAIDLSDALQAFIEANSTRPFGVQLALPLREMA